MTYSSKRIVTGEDLAGKSIIISESTIEDLPSCKEVTALKIIDLWATDTSPASLDEDDPLSKEIALVPKPSGTIFRFCDFLPESTYLKNLQKKDVESDWEIMTEGHISQVKTQFENSPHPFMHKTLTIDYGIVLFGEIYLILDQSETLLKPGDVIIQRGTNHFWSNRSKKLCRIAFILLDAKK